MAKNSMVQRELKRTKLVARFTVKRKSLKATTVSYTHLTLPTTPYV